MLSVKCPLVKLCLYVRIQSNCNLALTPGSQELSSPSQKSLNSLSARFRSALAPLYVAFPAEAFRFVGAVMEDVYHEKVQRAKDSGNFQFERSWETVQDSLLSGVLVRGRISFILGH